MAPPENPGETSGGDSATPPPAVAGTPGGHVEVGAHTSDEPPETSGGSEGPVDDGFAPGPPLTAQPPAYEAGATYAKNALASEGGQAYRSQAAGNKGNTPSEDADFVHWAPVSVEVVPLQKADYNTAP